jgi:hypothetical protein
MTATIENDNDVIVCALEQIISYGRRTQQIFIAQCFWWPVSVISLEQGLVIHVNNLCKRSGIAAQVISLEVIPQDTCVSANQREREVSTRSQHIQEDRRLLSGLNHIHPDRESQIRTTFQDIRDLDLNESESNQRLHIIRETGQLIQKSRKEQKALRKPADILSPTRSGNVIVKALSSGQQIYLQCNRKDTITDCLEMLRG